jgi:VIT1/CCC1 family predicted Fe2+/Mn2+ transporter
LVALRLMMALPYLLGMSGATALVTAVVVRMFFRRGRGYLDTRVRRR